MNTDHDFEAAVRARGAEVHGPAPTDRSLQEVLARRGRGERIAFDEPVLPRWKSIARWSLTGVAALLLLILLTPAGTRRQVPSRVRIPDSIAADLESASLLPTPLMAQTTHTPAYPVVDEPLGLRLKPGRWYYGVSEGDGSGRGRDTLVVSIIEHGEYLGQPVWRFIGGRMPTNGPIVSPDTTWTTRDSLRILARVSQAGLNGRIEETYGDTTFLRGETHGGVTAWESHPIRSSEGPSGAGLSIKWYQFMAVLQTARLSADWKASLEFRDIIFDEKETRDYLNIAVIGDEMITTPAGRFDCWTVGIVGLGGVTSARSTGAIFWVSKAQGWIVATSVTNQGLSMQRMLLTRVDAPQ